MRSIKQNKGFTLIEILIAMIVLAFGLLGLAGLQATSLKNNLSAQQRTQATLLAYDLADRVRANIPQITAYINALDNDGTANSNCIPASPLNPAGCTAEQMAQNDVLIWDALVLATLPSATGTMIQTGGMGTSTRNDDIFTITINWDDDRSGGAPDGNDPNFSLDIKL